MDQPTIKVDKLVNIHKSKGTDTISRLNAFIQFSSALVTIYIPKHGEYAIINIGIGENGTLVLLCKDPVTAKNFSWSVPWDTHFNLYLGEA